MDEKLLEERVKEGRYQEGPRGHQRRMNDLAYKFLKENDLPGGIIIAWQDQEQKDLVLATHAHHDINPKHLVKAYVAILHDYLSRIE